VAPRLWYEHIVAALLQLGFKQSATDQCFLFRPTIMIVLYVDDLGIAYSNLNNVEDFFANLANMGFEFTREGSFTNFLGIKFEKYEANNTVTLTQGINSEDYCCNLNGRLQHKLDSSNPSERCGFYTHAQTVRFGTIS
jgi:hypothetical protein